MGAYTDIEWTNATWNPLVGCSKVSEECRFCYAMTMAARIANAAQAALREGRKLTDVQEAYRKVVKWKEGGDKPANELDVALPQWNNQVAMIESVLALPMRWRDPKMVFVNSMSDLFHPSVPFDFVDKVFATMALTPQHTYQVLTKRPDRMVEYLGDLAYRTEMVGLVAEEISGLDRFQWADPIEDTKCTWPLPLPNVWLGASVGNQKAADKRREHLKKVADTGFLTWVSNEPSLGPVDWNGWEFLRWMVSGGESGNKARPSHSHWHRETRDWCQRNNVPFFFKQWGEWGPSWKVDPAREGQTFMVDREGVAHSLDSRPGHLYPSGWSGMNKAGKKATGRILDGRTWDEFPKVVS